MSCTISENLAIQRFEASLAMRPRAWLMRAHALSIAAQPRRPNYTGF
jgi:hypothetical protein